MRIEWDAAKDETDRRKHRVSFAVASEISLDPLVATVLEKRRLAEDVRFFGIGMTETGRMLSVLNYSGT